MTLRDLGAVDSQLDALDPNGSLAAGGRAATARAPRLAPSDVDRALDSLAEGVHVPLAPVAPAPFAAPTPEPKPTFSGLPPDADFTFIPGSMPVPKPQADADTTIVPGGEPIPRASEAPKAQAAAPAWSKTAEPIPPVESSRKADFGIDENLDFDDLFDELVAPAASAPVEVEPAPALSLDGRVSEVHDLAEPPAPAPAPDSVEEILDEDELEIVVDD